MVLIVEWASCKRRSTWKKKKKLAKNQKKENPKKVDDKKKYFHYNVEGHWRRNCLTYLATVKNRKKDRSSEDMSDLLVIKANLMIFFLLVGF